MPLSLPSGPDESRRPPTVAEQLEGTMFDQGEEAAPGPGWPERPKVRPAEQRRFPLTGSLEARYQRWRATEDGERVFGQIRAIALGLARAGAPLVRVKGIVDGEIRPKESVNNSHLSMIARELYDTEPELRDLIELRERPKEKGDAA